MEEPEQEETFCFPKKRVEYPIGEPLDEGFFIFLYFKKTETLPHGIAKAGCDD